MTNKIEIDESNLEEVEMHLFLDNMNINQINVKLYLEEQQSCLSPKAKSILKLSGSPSIGSSLR